MIKYIAICILSGIIFMSCGNRPNYMKYEVVFYTELGQGVNQIGSNIPLLTNFYTNSSEILIGDYLDVPNSIDIFKDKLYLADKYNKRLLVFPLMGVSSNIFYVGQTGEGYSFSTPFQVVLNKYGEIYLLASQSNVEYKNQTNYGGEDSPDTNAMKRFGNFYIYKFSPDGKFIYSIGNNGIHSEPMPYPDRIDIDLFDNVYAYYKLYEQENPVWLVKRFSPSGELSFEFSTKYISSTNIKNGNEYVGRVGDIYNLKNDERLVIYTDYYQVEKAGADSGKPPDTYHSLDVYSILQNAITKNIFQQKKYMDQFLKVTRDDILVLYSYDEPNHGVRFRFIDINSPSKNEEVYYAPILSDENANYGFYVDDDGQIYSILVKDNNYFVILRWIKVQSRKIS